MTFAKKRSDILDGIGLVLILFSFFVQMTEIGIESDIRQQENYHIHRKLDYIWTVVSHDYAKKYPEQGVYFAMDFKHYHNDYKIYSEDKRDLSKWEELVKYKSFTNIRLFLFIIGSVMLIVPKFYSTKT